MAKGWYVVHAYSGHENKVEKQLRRLMELDTFKESLYDIKVPSEEVVEVREGKKRVTNKKFLPGYVLIEMDLPERGWKEVCSEIRKVPGVTGFCGIDSKSETPGDFPGRGTSDPAEEWRNQVRQGCQDQDDLFRRRACENRRRTF